MPIHAEIHESAIWPPLPELTWLPVTLGKPGIQNRANRPPQYANRDQLQIPFVVADGPYRVIDGEPGRGMIYVGLTMGISSENGEPSACRRLANAVWHKTLTDQEAIAVDLEKMEGATVWVQGKNKPPTGPMPATYVGTRPPTRWRATEFRPWNPGETQPAGLAPHQAVATPPPAQVSPDGKWRWDGANWVPNTPPPSSTPPPQAQTIPPQPAPVTAPPPPAPAAVVPAPAAPPPAAIVPTPPPASPPPAPATPPPPSSDVDW